jgi:mannosyltransferase OCH1-like enzyme
MKPIPHIIHQVWLGRKPIPSDQLKYMATLTKYCKEWPNWTICLWTDDDLHELGITQEMLCYGSPAANSNLVRLLAVFMYGGIYLDTDCEVIGDLESLRDHNAWTAPQVDGLLCNACFGARKGHPWLLWQIMNFQPCLQDDAGCGPRTMTKAPREDLTIIDPRICYPFSWDTLTAERIAHHSSIIIHHWAKSWL